MYNLVVAWKASKKVRQFLEVKITSVPDQKTGHASDFLDWTGVVLQWDDDSVY
jgi:hypothetical protein